MHPAAGYHQAMPRHVPIFGTSIRLWLWLALCGAARRSYGTARNPTAQESPTQVPHPEWVPGLATHAPGCGLQPNHAHTCIHVWNARQGGWRCVGRPGGHTVRPEIPPPKGSPPWCPNLSLTADHPVVLDHNVSFVLSASARAVPFTLLLSGMVTCAHEGHVSPAVRVQYGHHK